MKDFDMTAEELANFETQLKDPAFKSLFFDYLKDLQDPKNKLLYEEEIAKLEAESGNKVRFINPTAGFCAKSFVGNGKIFVNLCSSPEINEFTVNGEQYSIPYSLSKPKKELDNSKNECLVYDVVFNPKSIQKGLENSKFKHVLILTAIEGIEKQFEVEIKPDYVLMKNMKVKGALSRTMIKEKATGSIKLPETEESSVKFLEKIMVEKSHELAPARETVAREQIPKFKIIHQNLIQDYQTYLPGSQASSRPQSLLIKIELPLVKSISNVNLDLTNNGLDLVAKDVYKLHLDLPFPTLSDKAVAKFEKFTGLVSVTVPVVQLEIKPEPLVADDASEDELSTVPNQLENVNVIEAVQKVVENIAEELSTVDKAPNDVLPSQPLVSKDIIPAHSTQNLTQGYSVIVDSLEKSLLNLEISASETLGLELNKSVKEKLKKESTSTDTNSLENSIASLSLKTELAPIEPISSVKSQPEDCRPNDKANNAEDTVEIGNYLKAIQSEVPSLYNSIPFKTHQSADCLTVILETTEKLEFTQSPLELILQFSSTKMTINFPSEISLISVDVNEFNTCILIEKSSEQFWKWIKIDGLEHRFPDYDVPVPIDDISLKLETRVKKDGIELQVTKSGDAKDLDLLFANDLVFELD